MKKHLRSKRLTILRSLLLGGLSLPIIFLAATIRATWFPEYSGGFGEEQVLGQGYDQFSQIDIDALITIRSDHDVGSKRDQVISYIWKGRGMPTGQAPEVRQNIGVHPFHDLDGVARVDELVTLMEYGVNSVVYLLVPQFSQGRSIIYYGGHGAEPAAGIDTIKFFIQRGYDIAVISMPLDGPNNRPVVSIPLLGDITLSTHDHFKLIETDEFSPLSYFIEPVVTTVNHLTRDGQHPIAMVGFSGGGWATVVAAALDSRIHYSFPVAGSLPISLRLENELGDYEQSHPGLLRIVSYLDLYLMGASGQGRKQLQVYNINDPCCFGGRRYMFYEGVLRQHLDSLGNGWFQALGDDTHKDHIISKYALNAILNVLEK